MATPGGEGNEPETRLVGDIGATNARFGLVSRDGAHPELAHLSVCELPDHR